MIAGMGAALTLASTWTLMNYKLNELYNLYNSLEHKSSDRDLKVEELKDDLHRIDVNIEKIATKLGISIRE